MAGKEVESKGTWKPVEIDFMRNNIGNFEDFSGLVMIEEFKPLDPNAFSSAHTDSISKNNASSEGKKKKKNKRKREQTQESESDVPLEKESIDLDTRWKEMNLHPILLKGISEKGFKTPTPIQEACIPPANNFRHNIIAAAETV